MAPIFPHPSGIVALCGTGVLTCSAPMAALWKRRSVLKSCAISRTRRWKGSLRISSSVDFWYRRISRKATVPGLQGISAVNVIKIALVCNTAPFLLQVTRAAGAGPAAMGRGPRAPVCHYRCPPGVTSTPVPVAMGLLHTPRGRCALPGGFGGQLLPRRLPAGGFPSRLLGTGHAGQSESVEGARKHWSRLQGREVKGETGR